MTGPRSVLVVGADGMIGHALAGRLRADGVEVRGTSRRKGSTAGDLYLDLARPETWPDPPPTDAAVLCAAVARLADCERDPHSSRRVNVEGCVELVRRLVGRGAFAVFLSSDKVFDGTTPRRARDDPPSPVTEYGRQKAEAEAGVLAAGGAVLRLSKVLAPDVGIVARWRANLARGEPVTPFKDMWLAPVPCRLVVETIRHVIAARRPGLYQLSGAEDRSYADLAFRLADLLGADPGLVRPIAAPVPPLHRPRFTTLDMSLEAELWDLAPPAFEDTLAEMAGSAG